MTKINKIKEAIKINKSMIKCPLCKFTAEPNKFLHNPETAMIICTECGIVFMHLEILKKVMLEVEKREEIEKLEKQTKEKENVK